MRISIHPLSGHLLVLALGTMLLAACGAKEGEEGGPCKPDNVCNEGLTCVDNVCESSGSGGGLFSQIYASTSFSKCANCHAPSAPGRTTGIETTQNWSSQSTAYSTLKTGKSAGLTGNFAGCNDVALVASTPATSLIVAAVDETTRSSFSVSACDVDSISDMTLKIGGSLSSTELSNLKTWITNGAPQD